MRAAAATKAGDAVVAVADDEDSTLSREGAESVVKLNGVAGATPDDNDAAAEEAPLPDDDREERLADRLGLRFKDPSLLRLALTHRSVLHDWQQAGAALPPMQSNERLEFLGDALLGAIVAEHLYERYPEADEGTLTRRRVALVRAETLVRWAREIDLGSALYLGVGERISAGARDRMLAGAFEALVGAIARDRGLREAKRFVRRFLKRDSEAIVEQEVEANPKGALQELLQERYRLAPVYRTVATEGPAHARVFIVEVSIEGRSLGTGSGASKREAQQAAARAALETAVEKSRRRGGEERGASEGPPPQTPPPNNGGRGDAAAPDSSPAKHQRRGDAAVAPGSSPAKQVRRGGAAAGPGSSSAKREGRGTALAELCSPPSLLGEGLGVGATPTPTPTSAGEAGRTKRKRTRRKRGEQ